MEEAQNHNQDFKYVLDDLTKLELGAKYTYDEIIDNVDISLKFRQICREYFEREVSGDTTVESHLYYLRPQDESFRAYKKIKTRVLCISPDKRRRQRDGSPKYIQTVMKIEELAALSPEEKRKRGLIIQEIEVSKVGLMSFVI